MTEPTWIRRILNCSEVYTLQTGDVPEEGSDDIYLALEADNGARYRLRLTPEVALSIYDRLTLHFQSPESPLPRLSHDTGESN
jgi:hypothetical protein